MSGGRVTIGGTNYQIVAAETEAPEPMAYYIGRGRTTIGGTNYSIKLYPRDIKHLLSHMQLVWSVGHDSASQSNITMWGTEMGWSGVYYLFSHFVGFLSIHKLVYNKSNYTVTYNTHYPTGSSTNNTFTNIYIEGNGTSNLKIHHARGANPTAATAEYGGGLFLFYLPGYLESEADSILSSINVQRQTKTGANGTASTRTVDISTITGKIVYSSVGEYLGISYVTAYNNYKLLCAGYNDTSVLYLTSTTAGVSTTGTSNSSVYAGGIGTIE